MGRNPFDGVPPLRGPDTGDAPRDHVGRAHGHTERAGDEDNDPFTGGPGMSAFIGELLNYRWRVDREGNVLRETVQKNIEAADVLRYMIYQSPQWMDYGTQAALTDFVNAPAAEIDPDRALFNARQLESDRMWAEEGLEEEGAPDQIGTFSW